MRVDRKVLVKNMFKNAIYINFEEKESDRIIVYDMLCNMNIFLTKRELEVFYFLYKNKNMFCTTDLLIERIWNNYATDHAVIVIIQYLKKKLKNTSFHIIQKRQFGYRFVEK